MTAIIYGMAVLLIRILFVFATYQVMKKLNWQKLFTSNNYHMAQYACLIISIGLGHLIGSFILTIIEEIQNILLSLFL